MTTPRQSGTGAALNSSNERLASIENPLQLKTRKSVDEFLSAIKILKRDGAIISDLYGPLQQLLNGKLSLENFNQRFQTDLRSSLRSIRFPLLTTECLEELRQGLSDGSIVVDQLHPPVPATPISPDKCSASFWTALIQQWRPVSWTSWTIVVLLLSVSIPAFCYLLEIHIHTESSTNFPCNISSREVLSAISRARTPFCKIKLAEFGCFLQNESVYPKTLPSFCPEEKPVTDPSITPERRRTVRILFVLTVHGRDSRQIRRLIRLIYHEEHYFIIHVDRRSDYLFEELLPLETILPNLKLLRKRYAPIWGGASLLSTLLEAMRFGLEQTGWQDWDYFLNLSESDLPIKSNDELVEYLASNFGQNFVKSHGTQAETFIKRQGLDKSFFECEDHMWRMGGRTLPSGIIIDGGSDWVALHRGFCQYLQDNSQSELLNGLTILFNHTLLPAESFFHTVLQNSQFCHSFINNNLRMTNWRRKKGCKCQYKHIVDWCGCSPNVLRETDLQKISNYASRPVFFARKFDPFVDLKIINRVLSEQLGTKNAKNRNFLFDENSAIWNRHWLNLFASEAEEEIPYQPFGKKKFPNSETEISFFLFESLKRLSAETIFKNSLNVEEEGKISNVDVTVDFNARRNLLITQKMTRKSGHVITFQSLIGFTDQFKRDPQHLTMEDSPLHRILNIQVSTDFDQKEEIFRNYAQAHGPYCDPALAYSVSEGKAVRLSVVWLDPADVVAGSFELNLTAESEIGLHQPEFRKPLRPGIWKIFLMQKWKKIAETKFLVFPLANSASDNLGPEGNFYIDHNFTSVAELFKPALRPVQKKAEAEKNGKKIGIDFSIWTDKLVKEFYSVDDFCFLTSNDADSIDSFDSFDSSEASNDVDSINSIDSNSSEAKLCRETPWSSFFPDDSQILGKIPAN